MRTSIDFLSFSLLTILLTIGAFAFARASEPVIWETTSRTELLKGDARGVSISDTGAVTLAPKLDQLFNTEQPYIWSTAVDSGGNVYLGTGHDGKIFRVSPDNRGTVLFDAAELDVTAIAIGRDGAVYAGTSPDGKVYRIGADGRAEIYFDPPDKYIWAIAVMRDGSLAIGTGDNGKLYRVTAKDSRPESSLLIDTNETHVISLTVDYRGDLIAGTDPGGIVLRISPDGKGFALYDSPLREIHALTTSADGSVYALALSDAAAGMRTSSTPSTGAADSTGGVTTTITMTSGGEDAAAGGAVQQTARSREDLSTARSAVFRILPDGSTDVIWSSSNVTGFSVAPDPRGAGVLIGTADKGRVYAVTNDGRDTLLLQTPEGQISSLVLQGNDVYAASSNQGRLFKFGEAAVSEGTFESPVRDAKLVSSWGRIWWDGSGASLQTRSGNSERPDSTWSDWSPLYADPNGAPVSSPRARFIQWRASLRASSGLIRSLPTLSNVTLAYLPRNVAPDVLTISFLPGNVGLQQAVGVPPDPNIELSGLDPTIFGNPAQAPPRKIFQKGARSIQWQAEDRNGDTLEYSIYYRPSNENTFRLLKSGIKDSFYTIDGATLADGRYVFRVVASDSPNNPLGQALTGERISEPVDIDNAPPDVTITVPPQINGDQLKVQFGAVDATGIVKNADISVDGGEWRRVQPADGIADSPRETFIVDAPVSGHGDHTIAIRVFDSSGNIGTVRATAR